MVQYYWAYFVAYYFSHYADLTIGNEEGMISLLGNTLDHFQY